MDDECPKCHHPMSEHGSEKSPTGCRHAMRPVPDPAPCEDPWVRCGCPEFRPPDKE